METNALSHDDDQSPEDALPQPTSSKVSAVLNGLGNGIMLGGAVYAVPRVLAALKGPEAAAAMQARGGVKGPVFAMVIGSALGTWYGLHEAKQLEKYRDSIADALDSTRNRVHTLEKKVRHLESANENRRHENDDEPVSHAEKLAAKREQASEEVSR